MEVGVSVQPLISIAIPCHNTASLLGWALASVVAQSYEEWECIIVDDGSDDHPDRVVAAFDEARFRLIVLDSNVGRAGARQVALDAAKGSFLAKLDADDWYYPQKLSRQVDAMQRNPDAALVSAGIAIEDELHRLIGVRARGSGDCNHSSAPLTRLTSPPVAHAPSLFRMDVARRYRYNQCLARSEDADYLIRILMDNRYCILNDVLYAYREYRSSSQRDTLEAYQSRMKMFWIARRTDPMAAGNGVARAALKWMLYRVAFMTGQSQALVARRSAAPSEEDIRTFEQAKSTVASVYERTIGSHASECVYEGAV
jgi:glycosyltransferase involved in cell wall biosynthesis